PAESRDVPVERLAAAADFLVLMAYDEHSSADNPGPIATPQGVLRSAAEELSYAQALSPARENEVPIEWDPESKSSFFEYDDDEKHEKHAVRFLDAPATMAQPQALASLKLRGSALWRLGAEDPKLFELFAKAPRFRVFDEQAARASLDGVIQNAPDDVAIAGEGELISLKGSPQG